MPGNTPWARGCNRDTGVRAYGEQLNAIAKRYPYEAALEIGCAWAVSTMAILTAQDHGVLTSVDIDPDVQATEEVKANDYESRWTFVLADSKAFWKSNTETFDLVFVDGDHSIETARTDLFEAWRALRPGGVLVIDDVLHAANLDRTAGAEGYLFGVAYASWQLVFHHQIREVRTTPRLLYIPKPAHATG